MPRANSSVPRHNKHKKILKHAKGYFGTRKSNYRTAKDAVQKSWQYSYRDRRSRKRFFRRLWIIRINAFVREHGYTYSSFMNAIKNNNINLDRKTLAFLAVENQSGLESIIKSLK